MEKAFSSLAELQAEIDLLKVRSFQQEESLKESLSSPAAVFNTVKGFFKSGNNKKSLTSDLLSQDAITSVARIVLPLFMNGVLFRKSGFITKTIITFLSQKAAKQVNSNAVSGIMDKVKDLFKKKRSPQFSNFGIKQTSRRSVDYGIPPDSESY